MIEFMRLSVVVEAGISRMIRVFSSTASMRARNLMRPLPSAYSLTSMMPPVWKSG
ncbi:MAG: hypothetical protein BWZ02_02492 [Lentisphaerae bacterium ADurb.BinA184]|nr:MAG: hypothetical protein BWZ02_02492 [Lentisphaerae bacterium ADurb.BinA184]